MQRLTAMILLAVLASVGCTSSQKSTRVQIDETVHSAARAVGLEKPLPATNFTMSFANRPQQLPDPSKNGQLTPGLVGQVFLYTPDFTPLELNGELTIFVQDTTARAPGQPPATPEAWHFTADVVQKLRMVDERWGSYIAVFLPWPPEWKDVNRLQIQGRYDQPGQPPIWSREATLTVDFTTTDGASAGGAVPAKFQKVYAVPDPKATIEQMKHQRPLDVNGAWAAPLPPGQVPPQPAATPMMPVAPTGEFQRAVIPRR